MSRNPKIVTYSNYVSEDATDSFLSVFRRHSPLADITYLDYTKKPDKVQLKNAEILVAGSAKLEDYIEDVKNVKWIQLTSAGFDPLVEYVQRTGKVPTCKFTRMGGTYGTAMAEYVLASVISHERRLDAMKEAQRSKQWKGEEFINFRTLSELTIGIVGAGDIGCEVARLCKGLGMRTIGLVRRERSGAEKSEFIDDYRLLPSLDSMLSESDVICSVLPSSPDTKEFFKGNTFQVCTKKPLFINIGRGDAVKDSTIIDSIRNGWLSGAVLDVTDPEPLPPESPLWDTPGVTISPHACGYTSGDKVCQLFLRNYAKYLEGRELEFEVDVASLL